MTKRKNSKKRKNVKIKLPFGVIVTLIIVALIVIGCWAYLHPDEAKIYVQTQIEKIFGKTTRPASPLPSTIGSDNLAFGIPGSADTIIDREGYALGYIEYHEQPAWVIYHMTYDEVTTKATSRNDNFREDPEILSGSATLADYRGSGYDRGHLAPAADMSFSIKTMDESFYMSNMSPQKGEFNRGIWKDLEAQIRSFAISEKDIFVVTGPILPKTKTITIGANKVTVPDAYYKVVYDRTPPEKMIGFILPNAGSSKSLQDFSVTVDAVEQATGLDFFNLLPQPQQEQLECSIDINAWNWQ